MGLWTAAQAAPVDDARLKGLAWLISHQSGEGAWQGAPGLEMAATASAVEAFANAGIGKGEAYSSGLAWLQNHTADSTDSLARQIIALSHAGRDASGLVSRLVGWRNDDSNPPASWGAYDDYGSSFPDTALALEAIKRSGASYAQEFYSLCYAIAKRNQDAGWPYFVPPGGSQQPSGIVPTAYSLVLLKLYAGYSVDCTGDGVDNFVPVGNYLALGITWLKAQQKSPGGGFGEGTSGTVLDTALAYRALVAVNGSTDPAAASA